MLVPTTFCHIIKLIKGRLAPLAPVFPICLHLIKFYLRSPVALAIVFPYAIALILHQSWCFVFFFFFTWQFFLFRFCFSVNRSIFHARWIYILVICGCVACACWFSISLLFWGSSYKSRFEFCYTGCHKNTAQLKSPYFYNRRLPAKLLKKCNIFKSFFLYFLNFLL